MINARNPLKASKECGAEKVILQHGCNHAGLFLNFWISFEAMFLNSECQALTACFWKKKKKRFLNLMQLQNKLLWKCHVGPQFIKTTLKKKKFSALYLLNQSSFLTKLGSK